MNSCLSNSYNVRLWGTAHIASFVVFCNRKILQISFKMHFNFWQVNLYNWRWNIKNVNSITGFWQKACGRTLKNSCPCWVWPTFPNHFESKEGNLPRKGKWEKRLKSFMKSWILKWRPFERKFRKGKLHFSKKTPPKSPGLLGNHPSSPIYFRYTWISAVSNV